MPKRQDELTERLLQASNYREFLAEFFRSGGRGGGGWTYSQFGRRAGFKSRSYVRDVVLGQRRLTWKAFPKFCSALGLDSAWKEYFRILVSLDEQRGSEAFALKSRLAKLRERIRGRRELGERTSDQTRDFVERLLEVRESPRVFAALGAPDAGATPAEVSQRLGISTARALLALRQLQSLGLVERAEGRYRAKNQHLIASRIAGSGAFLSLFVESLDRARARAGQAECL